MNVQNSILLGTLGRYSDRFHEFQAYKSLEDRLELAANIPRAHGVEPVYPQDIGHAGEHVELIKQAALPVSAVNVNIKSEADFRYGGLTNSDKAVRDKTLTYLKTAMDIAVELGTDMISVCPLIDGFDHAFQVDHTKQWQWLIEGLTAAAAHRQDVRVSVEYKPFESRNHIVLPSMSKTLLACAQVGSDNIGVTMDVGHALNAGENPAAELALADSMKRLFYVHFNDNNRHWDWDTLPGSVNVWETLEALYYIRKLNWSGWFAYDVFTRHGDPAEALAASFEMMETLNAFIDKVGMDTLESITQEHVPASAYRTLLKAML
ncbi:MAG: sugar phosphate isomerase/epimerase family protein [Deinococcota bacterium]